MSVLDKVQSVPRTVIGAGLDLARLPVNIAARASGQQGNDRWPPTVAFEGLEAGVETVVGSILRDDELVERGRVRQAKVAELRRAAWLETVAERKREQADAELADERRKAAAKRKEADRRTAQRKQQVDREAGERKQQVKQQAARKSAAASRVKQAQDEALTRAEQAATDQALATEQRALADKQQALDAAETVTAIDDAIEASKAARKEQ